MKNVESAVVCNEAVYSDEYGNLIVFTTEVMIRLYDFRQITPACLEAGGVLIGERRGHHMVVHQISEPGKGDRRSRYGVDRCGKHHQETVNNAFNSSSGIRQYLGEWHTHPENFPSPSNTDLMSWGNLSDTNPLILLIVGIEGDWVGKKVTGLINAQHLK